MLEKNCLTLHSHIIPTDRKWRKTTMHGKTGILCDTMRSYSFFEFRSICLQRFQQIYQLASPSPGFPQLSKLIGCGAPAECHWAATVHCTSSFWCLEVLLIHKKCWRGNFNTWALSDPKFMFLQTLFWGFGFDLSFQGRSLLPTILFQVLPSQGS